MKIKFIEKVIQNQNRPGRSPWESKEMTPKQFDFLLGEVPVELLEKLDRGGASILIGDIIAARQEAYAYSFPDIGENFLDDGSI